MSEPVRLGLVGLGSVSQRGILPHLTQSDLAPVAQLTAVCDVDAGRARATAEKFGVPHWYSDYEEMLAKAPIDAVVIATPIGLHFEQAMAAIQAGKHVHLNKTMTTTLEEANRLIAAARAAGRKLVASPGQLFRPTFRLMRRIVQEGRLGKVFFAAVGRSWAGHEFESFREGDDVLSNINPAWYYKKGGGPMYDMGVYALHEITTVLGPVKRVTGMSGIAVPRRYFKGEPIDVEMDDNTLLTLDFGDNTFAYVYATNSRGLPLPGMAICGFEGTLTAQRRAVVLNGKEIPVEGEMPYQWARHSELPEAHVYSDIMHLVDCILTDREPLVSGEQARHVVEIIEGGYKAAQTGQTYVMTTSFEMPADVDEWGPIKQPDRREAAS